MAKKINIKKNFKWIFLVVLIFLAYGAFQFFTLRRNSDRKQAIMFEQRQVLIDNWQAQGLSEEEIQAKLEEQRPGVGEGRSEHSEIFKVMRSVTGGSQPRQK